MNYNEKWVPSNEELESLGFEHKDFFGYWDLNSGNLTYDYRGFFLAPKHPYGFRRNIVGMMKVYPKSLSDLKSLISMLTP